MSVTWTKDQKKVIDFREQNLLVSAAAGSGKTAVLVERILSLITDDKHPVDVDRLLITTFTKAAAGEMKERIGNALQKRLMDDPGNEWLQRQEALLARAQITTIHGFCLYVIRNYFHTIDLNPNFRIADEGEMRLLKHDTAEELLEEGFVREIISKVQTMRKEAGFEVMDKIRVTYEGSEKAEAIFAKHAESIGSDVLADDVAKAVPEGYVKAWKINGEDVTIGVRKM